MDGEIVDRVAITMAVAVVVARLVWRQRCGIQPVFEPIKVIFDFMNGASVVPFLLLIAAVFDSTFLDALLRASKLSLGIAGFMGFAVVTRALLDKPQNDVGGNATSAKAKADGTGGPS